MAHYERIRSKHRGDPSLTREHAIHNALYEFFARFTTPFRVVRVQLEGEQPIYEIVMVYGHNIDDGMWHLRGDHRERDAVRLSIVMRNLYYLGVRDSQKPSGPLGLDNAMANVKYVMWESGYDESDG